MTQDFLLKNARIVYPDHVSSAQGWIEITDGVIAGSGEGNAPAHNKTIDAGGDYIFPGLIDLQINGGGGINFNDCQNDEDINTILEANLSTGTTTLLATLITDHIDTLCEKIRLIANHPGNRIAGIHVEGPFFNPEKRGMHTIREILLPTIPLVEKLLSAANGKIKVITLAPEMPGALEVIAFLKSKGVIASIAHSMADYKQTEAALEAGVTMATHLFNAMPSIHHRNPGMIPALLQSAAHLGLIADGVHLDPDLIRLLFKIAGANFFLVSDAIAPLASDARHFDYHGERIHVRDGVCYSDQNVMAGSVTPLLNGVVNAHRQVGLSLDHAVKLASLVPAQILGMDAQIGSITNGKNADFLMVSSDFQLKQVYKAGQKSSRIFNLPTMGNPS